ncbi:transcriptional regulator domain-containing protein [Hyphomicrobium zavarzinii]|uniref:transcriptional regulator domain-containing protein n=1 Tax=Hyphomicrobium zavarzinii TaxID=48292 RepID=UPI003CC91EC2
MERTRYHVGPPWPPSRGLYDYTLGLCLSDLAWEFLRRHAAYQRDYQLGCQGRMKACRLRCGVNLQRVHKRSPRADAWHLYSFRCPIAAST